MRLRAAVSEQRIAANRRNATKSTGPRTEEGKRRASRNALRHGLSGRSSHQALPAESVEKFTLDLFLVYGYEQQELQQAARLLAEAEADLARIRLVRRDLLAAIMSEDAMRRHGYASKASETLDQIGRLNRYEQRARRRRERAVREWLLNLEGYRNGNDDDAARAPTKVHQNMQ